MKQCITVDEQIALLKSHGVSFELMSESDARSLSIFLCMGVRGRG